MLFNALIGFLPCFYSGQNKSLDSASNCQVENFLDVYLNMHKITNL